MSLSTTEFADGVVLVGSQFSEPMRVIGNPTAGDGFVLVNLVGTRSKTFRPGVALTKTDLQSIQIEQPESRFGAKPRLVKLGLEALRISLAQEYDPFFGLSISRVDPLPHQLDAVYNHLLKSARCRFLLADDAGAGKTIMAGLLLKELKLRELVERVLIICPANLAFQWQREMADRFQESFHILRGADLRVQYGVNMWNEKAQLITSMDLAKREEILPSVRQAEDWDLIVVDEAHRMSARDTEHKSERYRLLLFTEYKDTLDYLVAKLRSWGLTVGQIHGSMKPGRRDEEGTRLWAERNFWDLKTQILVATEAAGEGINLQCCHVLFNYDIPWNPNRLEQRMGRIHR